MTDDYPDDEPKSAADPRPGGRPYYIDSECPDCGTPLVLYDAIGDEAKRSSDALVDPEYKSGSDTIWHDEFVCPSCIDGVHMDWPQDQCQGCDDELAVQFLHEDGLCWECNDSELEEMEIATKEEVEEAFKSGGEEELEEVLESDDNSE